MEVHATGTKTLRATVRTVAKLGREDWENEDFAMADVVTGRAAIADGASTSARPEVWARLLVESFVHASADPLCPEVLAELRQQWSAQVQTADLPWYAQAKVLEGAHSTFTGLHIDVPSRTYEAVSIGDSCLFHVREPRLLAVGPLETADQFGRFPSLMGSRPNNAAPAPITMRGSYEPGDLFVLATDALSKYLLATNERHPRFRSVTNLVRRPAYFTDAIHRLRHVGLLDNDDTTVCVVTT